ncbi:MAG: hypothetical protein ACO3LT_09785 [Ilumatobacteraceae bacterium]
MKTLYEEKFTWQGAHGITCDYTLLPGSPRTATEPATEDEIEMDTLYLHGHDIGEMCDILESNGARIWEQIQETILETKPWKNQ